MKTEPSRFWQQTFPQLFERGVGLLRSRADAGDEAARAQLEDVEGARGVAYVEIDGAGGTWLAIEGGAVRASSSRPEGLPVRLAMAIPIEAMRTALAELEREGALGRDETALLVASMASRRAEQVLEGQRLDFHLHVEGVPELGRVVLRVGLGVPQPPQSPGFTATVRFEDLERLRDGELDPSQLLTGGRVRFAGDYAPALQLGMQLAALPR